MAGGAAGAQGSNTLGTPSTGAATPGMQQPQGSGVGQLAQQGPTGGLGGMLGAVGSLGGQSNLLGQLGQATAGGQTPPNPFLGQGMPQQSPGFGPGVDNFAPGAGKISNTYPGMGGMGPLPAGMGDMSQMGGPRLTPEEMAMYAMGGTGQIAPMVQQRSPQQALPTQTTPNQGLLSKLAASNPNINPAEIMDLQGMGGQAYAQQLQNLQNMGVKGLDSLNQPQVMPAYPGAQLPPNIQQLLGNPQRGFPQPGMPQKDFQNPGMPQKGFPGQRPMPFPQQGGAGARTPLQGLGGLQQLLAQQNPNAYK